MSRRLRTMIAVVVAGVALACASSGGGNTAGARVRPPELQGLRFRPATQDGVPVVGTYKTSFSAMARTTIVR